MKQITTEELELLQKANIDFNKAKIVLADVEIKIRQYESHKSKIFIELEEISKTFKELESTLVEKYGDVNINLQTGEIQDDEN